MEKDVIQVFVYGTLKRGEANHRLLAGRALYMGEDAVHGRLFDLGAFPAAQQGEGTIYGEIWGIGPNVLNALDTLEGHPNFYKRELVTTIGGHEVWVYFMPQLYYSNHVDLPNGVWTRKAA